MNIKEQYQKLKFGTKRRFINSVLKFSPGDNVYYFDLNNMGDGHACIKFGKVGHGFQILKGSQSGYSEGQSRQIRLEIEGEKTTWPLCDIYETREEAFLVAIEHSNYIFNESQEEILISEV